VILEEDMLGFDCHIDFDIVALNIQIFWVLLMSMWSGRLTMKSFEGFRVYRLPSDGLDNYL